MFFQFLSQLGVRPRGRSLPGHVPGSTNMSFVSSSQDRNRIWILMNLVPQGVIKCDLFAQETHARYVVEFDLCENCVSSSWSMEKYRKVKHIGNSRRQFARLNWISKLLRVALVSELLCKSPSFLCFRRNLCIATVWPTRWRWRAVICQDLLSDLQPIRMTEIPSETKK